MDKVTVSRHDKTGKVTRTTFHLATLTSANFDTSEMAANAIGAALDGLCVNTLTKISIPHQVALNAKDKKGQNGFKWLIKIAETSAPFTEAEHEVGCADSTLTTYVAGGREFLLETEPEYIAVVNALEPAILSSNGSAVEVVSIELVGRNI